MSGPFSPNPARPKLRVKLVENGPFLDLGISYSELIVGIVDTLNELCEESPATHLAPALQRALEALEVHR
jgi:hypothetical protein